MNIRECPEYIIFLEALVTFVKVFPTDLISYGLMLDSIQIPESLQVHIDVTYGTGTKAAWIKIFQWALDTYPFIEVKERIHDAMQRSGMILRYRTFIRNYELDILKPEPETVATTCFPFFCARRK